MLIDFLLHTRTNVKVNCGKTLIELPLPMSTSRFSFCLAATGYSLAHFKNILHMKVCTKMEGGLFGRDTNDKAIAFW